MVQRKTEISKEFYLPKTQEDLKEMLKGAFVAGCGFACIIKHECGLQEQEELGAKNYVGEISEDELYIELDKIWKDTEEGCWNV